MLDLLLFNPKTAPDFFWDARGGVLMPGMSFTRGSSGWYYNSAGVLVSAGSNGARFDYDPVTLQPLGYLSEMQSTNLVSWSNAISGNWSAASAATVTNNAVVGPDGTANLASTIEDGTTAVHCNMQLGGISVVAGSVYGYSAVVKNISGTRWYQMNISGNDYVNFRPSDGAVGSMSSAFSSPTVRSLGNGLYRVSALYTAPATLSTQIRLIMVNASNSPGAASYAGDGTSGFAVGYIQFETAGVGVTSPIPTAGSAVTRAQDTLSLPLTSLPGWNPSQGGVLVATYRLHTLNPSSPGNDQDALNLNDGAAQNFVRVTADLGGSGTRRSFVKSGNVFVADLNAGTSPAPFTRTKQAVGWGIPRAYMAADGVGLIGVNTVTALPVAPSTLNIGGVSGQALNGTLESIAYYAGARSDAFVQAVSR